MAKRMEHMTEPELAETLNGMMAGVVEKHPPDVIGSMLIVFQEDGISQYVASVHPETAPQALRELADRLEKRETVKRGW